MLIETTDTESKGSLDRFCDTLEGLANAAKAGETERFTAAPRHAPAKRLDETQAARNPVLRWVPQEATPQAAE
jgi:glycine dehydrogenase subunit 2